MQVPSGKQRWFASVTAYTVAGALTSGAVGAVLALLGRALLPGERAPILGAVIAIGVVAAFQEVTGLKRPFPKLSRQTDGTWAKVFPGVTAPVLWGLDLGLAVTTRFTFAGLWFLVAVAIASQSVATGALVFVSYWTGRVTSVWIAPLLMRRETDVSELMEDIPSSYRRAQLAHVAGLAVATAIVAYSLSAPTFLNAQ